MSFFHATLFGFTAWRICLGGMLLLLYAVLKIRWSIAEKQRNSEANDNLSRAADPTKDMNIPKAAPALRLGQMPTVNLTDTQRIDHLHRLVSLKAGEQADLKELTFGRMSKFRVAFSGIEQESGQEFAHIKIELGGAVAECGTSVQELGDNDFLVPRGAHGDQHCTIHYVCNKSDAVSFLQVRVPQLNVNEQSAAIDILHVRGRQAA